MRSRLLLRFRHVFGCLGEVSRGEIVAANRFFDDCIEQTDEEDDDSEGDSEGDSEVERACAERASHVERECLAAGGDAETCARGARRAYSACVDANQGSDEESGDDHTVGDGECLDRALSLLSACIDRGGEPADCRVQAYAALERCREIASDDADQTDENACTQRARVIYGECVENGGEPRRCTQFAQAAHEQCESETSRP